MNRIEVSPDLPEGIRKTFFTEGINACIRRIAVDQKTIRTPVLEPTRAELSLYIREVLGLALYGNPQAKQITTTINDIGSTWVLRVTWNFSPDQSEMVDLAETTLLRQIKMKATEV